MVKLSSTKLVVALGGVALSLTAGVGVASADPDYGPLINTTCTYNQAIAALNDQRPDLARQFDANPMAQSLLSRFLASPADQRQQIVQQAQSNPMGRQYVGPIMQVAGSCQNYRP